MDNFDNWNDIKKHIESSTPTAYPKVGEVWMCSLGKNIGFEQNGSNDNFSRPVLIIKKFNNQMFWAIPLSTKQKRFDFYFNFTDPSNNNVSAILAQMKLISVKRITRKMYELPGDIVLEILVKIKKLLE